MCFAGNEHVVQHKLKHRCAFLLGGYDLVEVPNDHVHFTFAQMINGLPVRIPGIRYREGLDSFNSERSQQKRVGAFEISYSTHAFIFRVRSTLRLGASINEYGLYRGASLQVQTPGLLSLENYLRTTKPYVLIRSSRLHVVCRRSTPRDEEGVTSL